MRKLLLAAFPPEIDAIENEFASRADIVCSCVGVGITEAAVRTAELIIKYQPERVIFLGSCGALNSKHQLLSVATARTVSLADSLALNGKSYFPEIYQQRFSADLEFLEALNSDVIKANFYSPLSISKDSATAQGVYSELGDFENLELFGVAQACSHFNIKWNNLSVITNYLIAEAHQQWKENYPLAANITLITLKQIPLFSQVP